MADIFGIIYAILIVVGGVIGFIKAGSYISLASGLLFGAGAAYGAITLNYYCLLGNAVLLGGIMGYRYKQTENFMPAGLVAILSLLIIIRCIVYFVKKV